MPISHPCPCRHCKYSRPEIADRNDGLDDRIQYQVFCPSCRAAGPECTDEAEAVEKWDELHCIPVRKIQKHQGNADMRAAMGGGIQ